MPQGELWNLLAKKLSGEATDEELAALDHLLLLHPDWLYTVEQVQKEWSASASQQGPDTESSTAFRRHLAYLQAEGFPFPLQAGHSADSPGTTQRQVVRNRLLLVLIFFIAICGVVFLTGKRDDISKNISSPISEVLTRPGSRTRLVLADSSVVWLNSGSRLTYDNRFGLEHREVTLVGEAFFDVRKSRLPFLIHTREVEIKVMGTAFNVRAYDNDEHTETSLIRGMVEVSINKRPGASFVLKPNEKLVVANNNTGAEGKASPVRQEPIVTLSTITPFAPQLLLETSWVDNKLVFRDQTFEEVARKMERWYGVEIQLLSEEIKHTRLTGSFEKESVQQALEALQITEPFTFTIKGETISIN
jgi:ferric-dicitrate binding protein FerR (iron transport regulator)